MRAPNVELLLMTVTPKIRTICLIDPCLKDVAGHYFHYAQGLYQAAQAAGLNFLVLGNKSLDKEVREMLPIEPVFRYGIWDQYTYSKLFFLAAPLVSNRFFYEDLTKALKDRVDSSWLIFMVILPHQHLFAWKRWLTSLPPANAPNLAICLMHPYFHFNQNFLLDPQFYATRIYALFGKLGFMLFERHTSNYQVRLTTDNNRLLPEAKWLSHLPAHLLPFPYTITQPNTINKTEPLSTGERSCHFVSLGGIRINKGFELIVKALSYLQKENLLAGLTFTIQTHFHYKDFSKLHQELVSLKLPNVKIISEPLGTEDYYNLLFAADFVLLPYSQSEYAVRNSGVINEAFAAGKPVITTRDTWLSDQLENYGAGILINDGDYVGFAKAMLEAKVRLEELSQLAQTRSPQWVSRNNSHSFLATVIELFT